MEMDRIQYRLAFFTVDWNFELVEKTLHGLEQYTEDHPNVQICVFDCFGKDLGNVRDQSEYRIFQLPDLSRFDGLLIQSNQIVLKEAREIVAKLVKDAGIPSVSIGCEMEGCSFIYFDNRAAQYDMADHMIREHGARKLVYLTGNMENNCAEGQQRLDGFLEACRDNQVPEENIEVIRCTWRTLDGENVARLWLREKHPLPDAFVCANDDMALGLLETLKEGGVQIPRDVRVCGFDNLTSAELSGPRLSTVYADHSALDYYAADVLMRQILGMEKRKRFTYRYELICSESCGCQNVPRQSMIRDLYFQQVRYLKNFYTQQDQMAEDLFDAGNLRELMSIMGRRFSIFGCEKVYLCFNEYFFNNYDKHQWPQDARAFDETMVMAERGGDDPEEGPVFVRFPTRELLPAEQMERERFLIFYPLHYSCYSIGYIALNGVSSAAKMNLHESIVTFLEIGIENVRKKSLLQSLNQTLDDLYVKDALTGLYNRFGLARYGQQVYNDLLVKEGSVQVLFIDLDNMKTINDRHGHEMGDLALKVTASTLREICSPDAFIMRYGGDEFIVIDSGRDEKLPEALMAAVESYNRTAGMPFRLDFSIGVIRSGGKERPPVEECIRKADTLMYEAKQAKKRGRACV